MKSILLIAACLMGSAPVGAEPNGDVVEPNLVMPSTPPVDTIVTTEYVVVHVPQQEKEVLPPRQTPQPPQIILEWAIPLDSNLLHYPFILKKEEKK